MEPEDEGNGQRTEDGCGFKKSFCSRQGPVVRGQRSVNPDNYKNIESLESFTYDFLQVRQDGWKMDAGTVFFCNSQYLIFNSQFKSSSVSA